MLKTLFRYDLQLFRWVYALTENRQCSRIVWLSRTGDGHLYLLIGLLLWAFEPHKGELFLFTALMAYALEIPVYLFLKKLFKRPRPCDLFTNFKAHITPSDKFSLPSGHTAAAFLMACMLANFYPVFAPLAFLWASGIGLSRVLLGVHYPSDVVIGAMLGATIAAISLQAF